jgi:hypothetical protein
MGDSLSRIRENFFPDSALSFFPETPYSNANIDHLFRAEYPGDSLVTASYKSYSSNKTMYGHGGEGVTAVPEGANILIRAAADEPGNPAVLMGYFPVKTFSELAAFPGSIQAFEYTDDKLDITVFANTLTQKNHQQGDYGYAANAIYSKMLGAAYAE